MSHIFGINIELDQFKEHLIPLMLYKAKLNILRPSKPLVDEHNEALSNKPQTEIKSITHNLLTTNFCRYEQG